MKNQVQLIAYVDRFSGGGFRDLQSLLMEGPLAGLFGGIHLLPFFWPIDGADAGFDPIDHTKVDPKLGVWDDVRALSERTDVMADLIVNHISSRSPQFTDFRKRGDASPYAFMFHTYGGVFPEGAAEAELLQIYRPRPGLPFTKVRLDDGVQRLFWTTFTSEQVDIDVRSSQGKRYLDQILNQFQVAGIRAIRLDAAGYAIKKRGTSCFMIPETFAFIDEITRRAHERGIEVLVEIHSHYLEQIEISRQVDWVYDFALPPLVLHSPVYSQLPPSATLAGNESPQRYNGARYTRRNRSDRCRSGSAESECRAGPAVRARNRRSRGDDSRAEQRRKPAGHGAAASNLDLYQVNCTFYDALGRRDDDYRIARAIQFFAPGVPQVYYVGLLAGTNDLDLLRRTGVGRDINRHHYTRAEL